MDLYLTITYSILVYFAGSREGDIFSLPEVARPQTPGTAGRLPFVPEKGGEIEVYKLG